MYWSWFHSQFDYASKNLLRHPRNQASPRKRGCLSYLYLDCFVGADFAPPRNDAAADYRFEYWKRLRALGRPYFLRSTVRASRVRNPAFFKGLRRSGSIEV